MSGIAGVYRFDSAPADRGLLAASIRTLRHRGPDGSGLYTEGPAGLAHTRLNIVPPGGGWQPLTNEDGTLWLAVNGEIFNHAELREDLQRRGHRFRTPADAEVILHLYEEHGGECVKRMSGHWALALWDSRKRRLVLSRDRVGIRPLYYTRAREAFLFGSEIKALLVYPEVRREPDLEALEESFTFSVPLPPRTMFRGIEELPPGHSAVVSDQGVELARYWEPGSEQQAGRNGDAGERFVELLTDAVRLRLRSEAPVGAYLSADLESAVTAALVRRLAPGRLRTYSVTPEGEPDESGPQKQWARYLETDHEELRYRAEDIGRVLPAVIRHLEKPVLQTSAAPRYLLSKLVRARGHRVVLMGEAARTFCPLLPGTVVQSYLKSFFSDQVKAELNRCREVAPDPRRAGAASLPPAYLLAAQAERAAMAHSVEGRFPFLDHRVIEFNAETGLLRQCARSLAPAAPRRFRKAGRGPEGLRITGLDYAEELLRHDRIRRDSVFDPAAVQKLVNKVKQGRRLEIRERMAVIGILSTELVMDQFMNNLSPRAHAA